MVNKTVKVIIVTSCDNCPDSEWKRVNKKTDEIRLHCRQLKRIVNSIIPNDCPLESLNSNKLLNGD